MPASLYPPLPACAVEMSSKSTYHSCSRMHYKACALVLSAVQLHCLAIDSRDTLQTFTLCLMSAHLAGPPPPPPPPPAAVASTILRTTTSSATATKDLARSAASIAFSAATSALTSPSGQHELRYDQKAGTLSLKDRSQPQVGGTGAR